MLLIAANATQPATPMMTPPPPPARQAMASVNGAARRDELVASRSAGWPGGGGGVSVEGEVAPISAVSAHPALSGESDILESSRHSQMTGSSGHLAGSL